MRNLPPNVYLHSYLQKAGVRFNQNLVDTIAKKGFGYSFYVFLILFALLVTAYLTNSLYLFHSNTNFYILSTLVVAYLLLYIYRVVRFRLMRKKLREDNDPIVVEAYAIVLFDISPTNVDKIIKPKKSAVLYKESGSKNPRFFTGAVKSGIEHHYYKDQIARVFIDRRDPKYYSVDDDKFYKTVSEKKLEKGSAYAIGKLVGSKLNKDYKSIGQRPTA